MTPSSAKGRVLVIDDAPEFLQLVSEVLRRDGYDVLEATDGLTGLELAEREAPALVVLDLTLPDLDGMEVCRQLHERSDVLVLMLTARDDEVDRVMGLRTGADDYVTKPFAPRELVARVEALLRRPRRATEGRSSAEEVADRTFDGLVIRPSAREVEVRGETVELTRIEFDILDALTERPRMVHERGVLRQRVWGDDWYGDDHVVDVHIANLRKKIDRAGLDSYVRTVRGVGYRFGR